MMANQYMRAASTLLLGPSFSSTEELGTAGMQGGDTYGTIKDHRRADSQVCRFPGQ